MSTDAEITTQQAAGILNVTGTHVIKLLEKGEIPFRKVRSHRSILLQNVLEYQVMFKTKKEKSSIIFSKKLRSSTSVTNETIQRLKGANAVSQ